MLTAKVLRCVNLRNVALGTTERQDPFVTLTLEENPKLHSKTDVCYSGGMNPQWHSGNWMRLTVPQPNMTCLVQVWDKHSQDADELIATGTIKLGQYDDDGAEDEPMAVDLYWQNNIPAGQVHLIFSYDPPVPMAYTNRQSEPSAQTTTTESTGPRQSRQFEQAQPQQEFFPWLNLQIRHKSGKVKNFLLSRSKAGIQQGYTRGRGFVENRAPAIRSSFSNQVTNFKRRPMYQQSMMIAAAILLVVLPWPRSLAYGFFSGLYDMFSSFGNSVYTGASSLFQSFYSGMSALFATLSVWGGYVASYMWKSAWYIGLYLIAPIATVLFLPRFLGWCLSRLGTMVLGGPLVSFGTVTFVPWMTDFKRLKFRLILVDFLLGNPRDKGYTPRFVSFNRFEFTGSLTFADMWRTITFNYQPCPLKDVPDYKRLSSLRVDHMELDGLTVNLEVNDRNKLNLLDFVSEVDRAHTNRALAMKELLSPTFRFPNCLEVQVLGARNLRSMDNNGLADPFYTVRVRKQELTSTTVVKTLNPNFPPRIEQFFVNDPSAVVSVVLQDEDIARPADFIGQWNVTAKWLLINPKKCKHVEWEILSEDERRQGWVGFWAPLVDEHFRNEGLCGDVHLRVRWVFNPALPDIAPGDRRETQTPLQQLNTLRHEIRQRLGDLQRIFDILKHVPVLIDYQGVFVLNDTKVSLHDLLYGRRHHGENVVTKIIANQREETDRRQAKLTSQYPRSLEVRETTAAVDRDRIQPVDTGVQPVQHKQQQQQQQQRPTDAIDEVIIKSADPNQPNLPRNLNVDIQTSTGMGTVSTGPSGPTTSAKITPVSSSSSTTTALPPYTATMEPVKPTSTATTGTSSTTGLTSADMTGGNLTGGAPTGTTQQRSSDDESQRQHELNKQQMAQHEGPEGMTFVRKEDQASEKDVMSREERAEFQRDRDREKYDLQQQQQQQQQSSWLPTSLTGGTQPTTATSTSTDPNLTSSQAAMKERIEGNFREGDKLMAVYPEKLVTSAPGADRGYVRGELAGIQRELGSSSDVYLGYEEDDEAAEMRNEDRYNDDEREYDQDGREFIKVQPIVWRKQFLARHGDPGLNLYKFLERLIRGLIPKLASDTRLRRAVEGTAIKGIFKGEVIPGRSSTTTTDASGTTTTHRGGVVGAMAHKVAGGIRDAAHSVKDQAKLVEKKVMHQTQDAGLQTDPSRKEKMTTYPYEQPGTVGYVRERETPAEPENAKSMDAARPVHGQDADFNRSDLVISGSLEAVWQGRHRLTSMFRRYKLWHVEIKGETIFYHKMSALNANPSATDAVWYTLDLTWLQDIYLTESHRAHNNELILQFVQDDHTLHLRLPSKVTTPTLSEWLSAFRQVQRSQQDRRRLGSMAGTPDDSRTSRTTPTSPKDVRYQQQQQQQQQQIDEEQTTTWPGEDLQPQQRARGSSLLSPQVNVSSSQPVTASATTTTSGTAGMAPMAGVMTAAPPMPPSTTEMAAATSTSTAPTTVSQPPSTTGTTSQMPTTGKPQEVTVELKKEPQIKELGNFDATTTDPTLTRQVAQS